MSGLLIGIMFWTAVAVFVGSLVVIGISARSDEPIWRRRGRIAALALVLDFVFVMVALYLISSSNDPGWIF